MVETDVVGDAWRHARGAARACDVTIRQVGARDIAAAQQLIAEAWGRQQIPQSNLLHALSHAGNTVLVAVRGTAPLGVAFGFLGWNDGLHLHSHMTAVTKHEQSRGIGYALKSWQRAVCLEHGVTEMRWTFDPLMARNAYFNLVKLGGRVQSFFPDFYGPMDDEVNAGDQSDRFEISWQLDSQRVTDALAGRSAPADASAGDVVPVPSDFDAMRRASPLEAKEVRTATSRQFSRLFDAGLRPEWAPGGYVFVPSRADVRSRASSGAAHG